MSSASIPDQGSATPLSEPQRIINTYIAPTKTFTDLKRVGRWWAPFLLICLFSYVVMGVVLQRIGLDQIAQNQLKMSPKQEEKIEKLPPEDRALATQRMVTGFKVFIYFLPIPTLIIFIVIAALLMASFNFGAGAEIRFGTALAVVSYAYLPGLVRGLLTLASVLAGADPESFNLENPIASNLGHLLSPGSSPALYTLLSRIDIFSIWICALMGIGFAAVSKLKRSTTMAVVFGWYALYTLWGVGWAVLFS